MTNLLGVQTTAEHFSTMQELLHNTTLTLGAVSKQLKMVQQEYTVLERQQSIAAQCKAQEKQPVPTIVVEDADGTSVAEENAPGCTFDK
jgi:hypothetical protein